MTIGRVELAEALSKKMNFSFKKSKEIVDEVIKDMCRAIIEDELLKLSSFGTFKVRHKNARIGRNPKTKEAAIVTERKVISFKPSGRLKIKVKK